MQNSDFSMDEADTPFDAESLSQLLLTTTEPLLPCEQYPQGLHGFGSSKLGFMFSRDRYVSEYGFVLLTKECVEALVALLKGKKVLDAGSGTGFLSYSLAERGIDITAQDLWLPNLGNPYTFRTVWKLDALGDVVAALPSNCDAVILTWPCHGTSFAHEVAQAMRPGQVLIYEGEGAGGATADDDFFGYLNSPQWHPRLEDTQALNRYHRQFPGIRDRWAVFEKR